MYLGESPGAIRFLLFGKLLTPLRNIMQLHLTSYEERSHRTALIVALSNSQWRVVVRYIVESMQEIREKVSDIKSLITASLPNFVLDERRLPSTLVSTTR